MAGVFQLVTTIFAGALLLLAADSLARGLERGLVAGEEGDPGGVFDVLVVGGQRTRQPVAFWTFLVGAFALAGVPFVSGGFWSRDAVLARAWEAGGVVFWPLVVAAGAVGFGVMRLVCLLFLGVPRSRFAERATEGSVSPVALVILAVLAVAVGWVGIPAYVPFVGRDWLTGFVGGEGGVRVFVWEPMLLGILSGSLGLLAGFVVYTWKLLQAGEADLVELAMGRVRLGWLYRLTRDGLGLEKAGRVVIGGGALWLAGALAGFDAMLERMVDGVGRLWGAVARASGWADLRVLDAAVEQAGRTGDGASRALVVFDVILGRLAGWAGVGALALARLGDAVERRVLGPAVDGAAGVVRAAERWFQPRTGKVQGYLLLAFAAVMVLVVIFVFFL